MFFIQYHINKKMLFRYKSCSIFNSPCYIKVLFLFFYLQKQENILINNMNIEIIKADLNNKIHQDSILYLINEYAKDLLGY